MHIYLFGNTTFLKPHTAHSMSCCRQEPMINIFTRIVVVVFVIIAFINFVSCISVHTIEIIIYILFFYFMGTRLYI